MRFYYPNTLWSSRHNHNIHFLSFPLQGRTRSIWCPKRDLKTTFDQSWKLGIRIKLMTRRRQMAQVLSYVTKKQALFAFLSWIHPSLLEIIVQVFIAAELLLQPFPFYSYLHEMTESGLLFAAAVMQSPKSFRESQEMDLQCQQKMV